MAGQSSWRSLRTVMLVTIHVAAVAYVLRFLARPSTLAGSLVWVPITIGVAVFLSWPVGRAIAWAFDPAEEPFDPKCPRCGRYNLRPLIKPGAGLFQPPSGYRCPSCGTAFWYEPDGQIVVREPPIAVQVHPPDIAFLSDPLSEEEMRFLDEDAPAAPGS